MNQAVKWVIVIVLFSLLSWCTIQEPGGFNVLGSSAEEYRAELEADANAALADVGYDEWASVQMRGRVAQLTGSAPSAADLEQAVRVVRRSHATGGWLVGGVRRVNTENLVLRETASPYVFNAVFDGETIVLTGHVPDQATKRGLEAYAAQQFGADRVRDETVLASGVPEGADWGDAARYGLSQLDRLRRGELRLEDNIMRLEGVAGAESLRDVLRQQFVDRAPEPFQVETDLRLGAALEEVDTTPITAQDTCQEEFNAILETPIEFATGSADVRAPSRAVLRDLAIMAQRCASFDLLVEGHTDGTGPREENIALSQRRAEAVVAFLRDAGVAPDRMSPTGVGPDRPIATNASPEGRARNRRIEFQVLERQ